MTEHSSRERRIRVLQIAELCNPEYASVPLVGWSHSRALAAISDAHLVTNVRHRPNILKAGLVEGTDFTALDPSPVERPLARVSEALGAPYGSGKAWTMHAAFGAAAYYLFERLAWRRFREPLLRGEFDLVHRITPLSPATPSPMARLCREAGVPFVLGPLNGGLPWPRGFFHVRVAEREWLGFARWGARLLPAYASTRACAAAIVVGSRQAWSEVAPPHRAKTVYVPENGVDPALFAGSADPPPGLPLRVAFAGRLVPVKGVDMLLEAAAPLAREGRVTLELIGDGPERPRLERLARSEGIAAAVRFAGWVDQRELRRRLQRCRVFAFPSIRDFGGAAVLEAMALGLVPVVVGFGGPGELVSPSTGFTLPLGSRREIVAALGQALAGMAADPSSLAAIGARARERALGRFSWPVKAAQLLEVYRFALGRRELPNFGMPFPDPQHDGLDSAAPLAHALS